MNVFITEVASLVAATDDEHVITAQVAERLSALLASGYELAREVIRPSTDRHVTYPLHVVTAHCADVGCGRMR